MRTQSEIYADILTAARAAAAEAPTWADLSNAIFDPVDGILAGVFKTREERKAFIGAPEGRAVRRLVDDAIKRTGLLAGAVPTRRTGLLAGMLLLLPEQPSDGDGRGAWGDDR
jgi:hypothetical protein